MDTLDDYTACRREIFLLTIALWNHRERETPTVTPGHKRSHLLTLLRHIATLLNDGTPEGCNIALGGSLSKAHFPCLIVTSSAGISDCRSVDIELTTTMASLLENWFTPYVFTFQSMGHSADYPCLVITLEI